jgi:hypothetical protein
MSQQGSPQDLGNLQAVPTKQGVRVRFNSYRGKRQDRFVHTLMNGKITTIAKYDEIII